MQLWKGFEYSRISSMPGFCVCKRSQGSEYMIKYDWIMPSDRVLNMPGSEYNV